MPYHHIIISSYNHTIIQPYSHTIIVGVHHCSTIRLQSSHHALSSPAARDQRLGIAAAQWLQFFQREKQRRIGYRAVLSRNAEHLYHSDPSVHDDFLVHAPNANGVTAPNPVTTTLCISCCHLLIVTSFSSVRLDIFALMEIGNNITVSNRASKSNVRRIGFSLEINLIMDGKAPRVPITCSDNRDSSMS